MSTRKTIATYLTLSEAIEKHTAADKPEQAATRILSHLVKTHPTATHAVLFVNQDFSSSLFGAWTVLVVGPDQTYKTPEQCEGAWLNDLPSQRQYPVAVVEIKREA